MQHPKQSIQLSEHIKNKLRQQQVTPLSLSSGVLTLSDTSDDDDDGEIRSCSLARFHALALTVFIASATPSKLLRRRSSTFITYRLPLPAKSQSVQSLKRADPTPRSNVTLPQPVCHECRRRENLLRSERERIVHVYNENRKLTEQLRSAAIVNHHYHEENGKLKLHLSKINAQMKESQLKLDLLKRQQDPRGDQIQRLRRELHIYNEVVAAKEQEEQERFDYYANRKRADGD